MEPYREREHKTHNESLAHIWFKEQKKNKCFHFDANDTKSISNEPAEQCHQLEFTFLFCQCETVRWKIRCLWTFNLIEL